MIVPYTPSCEAITAAATAATALPADLRQAQIYAPFLMFRITLRLLNHDQPLLDNYPTLHQDRTFERIR